MSYQMPSTESLPLPSDIGDAPALAPKWLLEPLYDRRFYGQNVLLTSKFWQAYKRVTDIVLAVALIVLFAPVMLIVALAIKLDSRGPVLFSRRDDGRPMKRVGLGGRSFQYFKFRSMRPNTHAMRYGELAERNYREGPLVKIYDDPRVTRVGRFIRRYSLDELPEFFLALLGDLHVVGAYRPREHEEVQRFDDHAKSVFRVKPSITGLPQVMLRNGNFTDELRLSAWYIENWSPWLDILIVLRTPFVMLTKHSAD